MAYSGLLSFNLWTITDGIPSKLCENVFSVGYIFFYVIRVDFYINTSHLIAANFFHLRGWKIRF